MKRIAAALIVVPVVVVAAVAVWFWQASKGYDAWPCLYGEEDEP